VEITTVLAAHESTVARGLLTDPERKSLEADNVSLSLGPSSGYVIRFTEGLTVDLSGDTAVHSDMKAVVVDFHNPGPALLNLRPNAATTLSETCAVSELVKPAAVIATQVNENATSVGKVRPDSRTAAFINAVKGRPVCLALSGTTIEFDDEAKWLSGC